jgi:hypothetical protein
MERAVVTVGFGTVVREISRPEVEVIRRELDYPVKGERVIVKTNDVNGVSEIELEQLLRMPWGGEL